jgi:hypothetical protein
MISPVGLRRPVPGCRLRHALVRPRHLQSPSVAVLVLAVAFLGSACSWGEPTLVVANRTTVPVVVGYGPVVPPCATVDYTWSELTTPNDDPVPPGAWTSPTQIAASSGMTVVSLIVTAAGEDVREGRVLSDDLPPCQGRPPDQW